MYQPSERMHADTSKDSRTSTHESDTMEGTGFLENEQVYWDHPRHARKRPRLMEDVSQTDTTRPSSPSLDANASNISTGESSYDVPTPPTFAFQMETTMRQISEMSSEVERLKNETERVAKHLQDNFRATSEESRRLEARLVLLEQSNHSIAQVCQSECCRTRGYTGVEAEQQHVKDNVKLSTEPKRLLQGDTSLGALFGKLTIPVHDSTLRLKVVKLLDEIYEIVKSDLLAPNPAAEHESHVNDDRSTKMNATLQQSCLVEASESSSGASSRSVSQSPDPPNSSRHTTPIVESGSPESNALSSRDVLTPASAAISASSAAKGPHPPIVESGSPSPAIVKGPSPSALRPIFIHPPFTTFPDSHLHPEGLSYDLLAANTDWFLDPADFVSNSPDAVQYPRRLDPSTNSTILGVVDNNGQARDADRRLRCTFCRRTYTGEDAGRAWKNHVREQHSIILDNERHDNGRPQVRNMSNEIKSSSSRIASPLRRSFNSSAVIDHNRDPLQSSSAAISPRIIPPFSTHSGLECVDTRVAHHAKT